MKKRALYIAILSAVVILVSTTIPALAAWIGNINNTAAAIKEPLSTKAITLDPQEVFPGQEIVWMAEVKNTTDNISYGVQYSTWAYYNYHDYGGLGGMAEIGMTASTAEPVEQREKLTLEMPAYAAGGVSTSIGELTLFVDPDGLAGPLPERKYVPGQTINIQPGATHLLRLRLNVSLAAYPGTVMSYIDPYRTAPVTQ